MHELSNTVYKWRSSKTHKLDPEKKISAIVRSLKVTVQFESEGSGQNEIFIHMDRSEVKP